jgi:HSP20 family protein
MNLKSLVPWKSNNMSDLSTVRPELLDPFVTFRREVDRMFDSFLYGGGSFSPAMPAINVAETDNEIVVTAELPGLSEKDVQVRLEGDVLTVSGEKTSESETANGDDRYVERRFGSFSRSVQLPFVPDEDPKATCDKGVLTVRMHKPADLQKQVRRIEVRAA